jgi:hypothetical protein|tara:strand:- start:295 stop:480 length:186 start_codon:yes stop_codon:yes gene_type:complete
VIFLSAQVVDEGRRLEMFVHRLKSLGIRDPWSEIDLRELKPAEFQGQPVGICGAEGFQRGT